MAQPLVDISTFVAVTSLFIDGPRDPWARRLAGGLADVYIYSDSLRYILPMPGTADPNNFTGKPPLLTLLEQQEPELLSPQIYDTDSPPNLREEYLMGTFGMFKFWAQSNARRLREWTDLHGKDWVIEGFKPRTKRKYVFDSDLLRKQYDLDEIANQLNLYNKELLLYTFDVILRYPLYGALAGTDSYFFNHPIRSGFHLPTSQQTPAPLAPVCITFAQSVEKILDKLDLQSYVRLLVELRTIVRNNGIHLLNPSSIEREKVREVARSASLTPYLRNFNKATAVTGGLIGGLGAISVLGPPAALLGSAVAISGALWEGNLPSIVNRARWLQWAVKWEVESQLDR